MREDEGIKTFVDTRRTVSPTEGVTTCRKCGCTIIVLPNDKRHGFCYDCYDPLENDDVIRFPSALVSRPFRK